jgi:hypothetical protein
MVFLQLLKLCGFVGGGGGVDSPSKRKKPKATKMLKKRGAYPKSAARLVGRSL